MFESLRKDFIFNSQVRKKPLIYLDNAATTQKPKIVIDKTLEYYEKYCSSINRSAHYLCEKASEEFEKTRDLTASFINAKRDEIIFTKGCTQSINLVANTLGQNYFKPQDEIILTIMEHHANIVPFYMLKEKLKINLKIIPLTSEKKLDLKEYKKLFSKKTKLVAFCHASNVLGIINPAEELVKIAKSYDVPTLIDAAQSIPHLKIDVKELACDFLAFSAHKIYGPTGVGVLFMSKNWQELLPPYETGGDMIEKVDFEKVTFAKGYKKFEAGTPNIAGVIGFKAALEYINNLNKSDIFEYEKSLHDMAYESLQKIAQVKILGPKEDKISLISFIVDGIHPHDISSILDYEGIAIRTGHLCAEPLIKYLKLPAVCRASFSFYNSKADVDAMIESIKKALRIFKI